MGLEPAIHTVDVVDPVDAIERCYQLGWAADGLPVVPPTRGRVAEFLAAAGRSPDEVLGEVAARRLTVTVGAVAANAVMAGCRPDYFPVVLAAVEAALDDRFHLPGLTGSTGGSAVLTIVNGPVRRDLEINCTTNLFGPGNRANATIGRALRLVLMNACGATPGVLDRSTFGHPGKYTYCIGEDEDESPWLPLHVERGFARESSVVTVFACEGPHQVRPMLATDPEGILGTLARALARVGTSLTVQGSVEDVGSTIRKGEAVLIVGGEHRAALAKAGVDKRAIRQLMFERARVSVADVKRAGGISGPIEPGDEHALLPVLNEPEDLMVLAGGGSVGPFDVVIHAWGPRQASRATSREIRR